MELKEGDRVKLSPKLIQHYSKPRKISLTRVGTVTGVHKTGVRVYVRWDGNKSSDTYASDYLELA